MGMIQQNALFGPGAKYVKFADGGLSAIEAANTAAKMPLSDLRIPYDQYARARVVVPKGAVAKAINVPVLGEAITLLICKTSYDKANRDLTLNKLRYALSESAVRKYTFTDILVLSATPDDPVPTIYVDNATGYAVTLDVFMCTAQYDAAPRGAGYDVFFQGLRYTDLRTADEYTTAVYQQELVQAYLSNTALLSMELDGQRLLYDDPALGRVCLEFTDDAETLQALSALRWALNKPAVRRLTSATPRDLAPPAISFKPRVKDVKGVLTASLAAGVGVSLTKADVVALLGTVTDDRDGELLLGPTNVDIRDIYGMSYEAISDMGTYAVTFSARDTAGNAAKRTVLATMGVPDTLAPVLTLVPGASNGFFVYPASVLANGVISKAALVHDIVVSCVDDVDGPMALTAASVSVVDSGSTHVDNISALGEYEVYFDATDMAGNTVTAYTQVLVLETI
jgi:hypothetical protein